jgi:membrane protease YdiL (CAAX protease family)
VTAPLRRQRDDHGVRRFAVGLTLGLLAGNNLVHLLPGASAAYVPLNLVATAGVTAAARRSGLSASDLGLRRDRLWAGARWGGAVAAVVAGALAVASAVPALHPLLDDARVQRLSPGAVAYHATVRIPLGTVLFEEVAFRGALFGALARNSDRMRAALASSAVFGLWHVRPTLGLLDANDVADDPAARAVAVAVAVLFTTAAGLFFCALRERSGSTLPPIVAHTSTNSLGLLASAVTS